MKKSKFKLTYEVMFFTSKLSYYCYLFCGVVGKLTGVTSIGPLPRDGPVGVSGFLKSDVKLRNTS